MIYVAIICLILLLYSYVGFPLLVFVLAKLWPRRTKTDLNIRPTVSIILPSYNEELVLRRCLNSLIALNYPADKLEILCGSDGSSDATNNILREFEKKDSHVRPYYYDAQRGKIAVLNDLAK